VSWGLGFLSSAPHNSRRWPKSSGRTFLNEPYPLLGGKGLPAGWSHAALRPTYTAGTDLRNAEGSRGHPRPHDGYLGKRARLALERPTASRGVSSDFRGLAKDAVGIVTRKLVSSYSTQRPVPGNKRQGETNGGASWQHPGDWHDQVKAEAQSPGANHNSFKEGIHAAVNPPDRGRVGASKRR